MGLRLTRISQGIKLAFVAGAGRLFSFSYSPTNKMNNAMMLWLTLNNSSMLVIMEFLSRA